MNIDFITGMALVGLALVWLTPITALYLLSELDKWRDRRWAAETAESDADWLSVWPQVEPDAPTPLYDRVICEQYEREFDQEAS